MAVQACPSCGSSEFERDNVTGDLVCTSCSRVIDSSNIVSEVTFGESATGAAVVTGHFVSHDQARATVAGVHGAQGESRAQTVARAKTRIENLAHQLGIPEAVGLTGVQYFKLALAYGFVKGRRSLYVYSACLYLACRKAETPHMLIDFAEKACINVFYIGATYLQLVRLFKESQLKFPDPSLFITRFASQLSFGEQGTKAVKEDAVKILKRMDRDWLREGRRTAGVAAAAILIAARMNNFRRSPAEIVFVAKIGIETLQRRLNEFKHTTSGSMTVNEFRKTDIDAVLASQPPSFVKLRELEKKLAEKQAEELEKFEKGEAFDDAMLKVNINDIEDDAQLSAISRELERTLKDPKFVEASQAETLRKKFKLQGLASELGVRRTRENSSESQKEVEEPPAKRTKGKEKVTGEEIDDEEDSEQDNEEAYEVAEEADEEAEEETFSAVVDALSNPQAAPADSTVNPTSTEVLAAKNGATIDGSSADTSAQHASEKTTKPDLRPAAPLKLFGQSTWVSEVRDDPDRFSDVDDKEVESLLLSEEEVAIKSRVWMTLNRDYLIEQENKRLKEMADRKNGTYKAPKKRRKDKAKEPHPAPTSAAESAGSMIQQRTFSKKINYKAIDSLFTTNRLRMQTEAMSSPSTSRT